MNGKYTNYIISDRTAMIPGFRGARIICERLDRFFSDRLVYRVAQALQTTADLSMQDGTAQRLEVAYQQVNQELQRILVETGADQCSEVTDLRALLELSIAETKARIAEKERVGKVASAEMSDEDLRQHYASLKRLRSNLASMQIKLDRLDADETEKAEARQKLPEIHERWATMPPESQQRFIRAATSRIALDELETGWLKLTIEWSPLLGNDIIDEAYIFTTGGKRWTDEEKRLVREHYSIADKQWLLAKLPDRGWEAIGAKSSQWGIRRPYPAHSAKDNPIQTQISVIFSMNDQRIMQRYDLSPEVLLTNRIFWREFICLPIEANQHTMSGSSRLPLLDFWEN
jgi:hypothetical protein